MIRVIHLVRDARGVAHSLSKQHVARPPDVAWFAQRLGCRVVVSVRHPLCTWTLRGGLSRTACRPMDSRSALGSFRDRLSQQEIDQVLEIAGTVAARYYDAKDGVTPV